MSDHRKNLFKWVNTHVEYQWCEATQQYVETVVEGYWYEGPWTLAKDTDAVYVAEDYRWRNDNGTIVTATWVALENTAVTTGFSPGDNIRLRVNFGETAKAAGTGLDTGGWTLQFSVDGGAFATVGAATDVKYFNSTNLTNGTILALANYNLNYSGAETQQDWGDECEDGVTDAANAWSNDFAEAEFSIAFDAGITTGVPITFRLLAPGTDVTTFTNVPTITLVAGAVDFPEFPPEITPDPVLEGKVPTLFREDTISPAEITPDPVLTGKVPTVERSYTVVTPYVALRLVAIRGLHLAGHTPTVISVTDENVTRTPAEITPDPVLEGKAPTANVTHSAAPGEVTPDPVLEGKVPTLFREDTVAPAEITPDPVLAGKVPTLFREYAVNPGEVTPDVALSGKVPIVMLTHSAAPAEITPDPVLTGKQPLVLQSTTFYPAEITPDPVLTGKVPIVMLTHSAAPAEVTPDPVLTGKVPIVMLTHSAAPAEITPDPVLTGKQPLVLQSTTFYPAEITPDPVLTGKVPLVMLTHSAAPAEITPDPNLAGKVPTLFREAIATPAAITPNPVLAGKQPFVLREKTAFPAEITPDPVLTGKVPVVFIEATVAPAEITPDPVLTGKVPIVLVRHLAVPAEITPNPTLAGKVPTLFREDSIVPAEVDLTLAGKAPTLPSDNPTKIPAEATPNLLGYAPKVNPEPTNIPVTEASLTLTGEVPSRGAGLLLRGTVPNLVFRNPEPLAGSATLEGKAFEIVNTGPVSKKFFPPRRLMTLQEFSPILELGQETEESSLGLVGWVPSVLLENPIVPIGASNLALTGAAPLSSRIISIDSGTALLAGQAPTLETDNNLQISVAAETLALAGQAPLVSSEHVRTLPTAAATLTLTEQPVYIGRSLSVPSRAAHLNGKAPTLLIDISYEITPAIDTLLFAGQAPTVLIGPLAAPSEVSLVLTGYAPTSTPTTDHTALPGAVALTFTTYSTVSFITTSVLPPAGSLALSTYSVDISTERILLDSARTKLISLTPRNSIEMLYN